MTPVKRTRRQAHEPVWTSLRLALLWVACHVHTVHFLSSQQKYRDLYESDKLRYDKEMGDYMSKHGHTALAKLMGSKGKRAGVSRS